MGCRRRPRARRSASRTLRPSTTGGGAREPDRQHRPSRGSPATTAQMANIDPTEMSISPVMMTSVMPIATSSTGRLARNRSLRFSAEKYPGAATARTSASATIARGDRRFSTRECSPSATWTLDRHRSRPSLERQREDLVLCRLGARQHAADGARVHHGDAIAHAQDSPAARTRS